VGKNDLSVSHRAQSTTFKQRGLGLHTSRIHINSRSDVVQGISDYAEVREESVVENVASSFMDLVESCHNLAFQVLVHVDSGCCCSH